MLETALDVFLGLLILGLALRALTVTRLYESAIFFIAFGLSMALAWARLAAPDVALAEAAIGAGLLGVLLIDSLGDFREEQLEQEGGRSGWPEAAANAAVLLAGLLLAGIMVAAVHAMPTGEGLTAVVAANMESSGVEHPVTAVLLNFRGYDTWLEIGVLWLAMLAIFCVGGFAGFRGQADAPKPGLVIEWLARLLTPLMVLAGGYLLWLGKVAPGGAFQAGVVWGAAGILLHLGGYPMAEKLSPRLWKTGLAAGFGFFLLLGLVFMGGGRTFLEYPPEQAGFWILMVETVAAASIGFTLMCFFIYLNSGGGRPAASRAAT